MNSPSNFLSRHPKLSRESCCDGRSHVFFFSLFFITFFISPIRFFFFRIEFLVTRFLFFFLNEFPTWENGLSPSILENIAVWSVHFFSVSFSKLLWNSIQNDIWRTLARTIWKSSPACAISIKTMLVVSAGVVLFFLGGGRFRASPLMV